MSLIDYNLNNILFAILMSFRLGAFFLSMPSFGELKFSPLVSVMLPVLIAFLLAPMLSQDVMPVMKSNVVQIALTIISEILIGVTLGFSVHLVLVLATMIGEITGMQAGFALATFFDPNLGQVSMLGFLLRGVFMIAFFSFNLHHVVIWGLVKSYETMPIGVGTMPFTQIVPAMVKLFAMSYFMAFRIVLPIIVLVLLSHVTMGVISITAPQMNIYFNAAITMNIVVAIVLFAISIPAIFKFFGIVLGQFQEFMTQYFVLGV